MPSHVELLLQEAQLNVKAHQEFTTLVDPFSDPNKEKFRTALDGFFAQNDRGDLRELMELYVARVSSILKSTTGKEFELDITLDENEKTASQWLEAVEKDEFPPFNTAVIEYNLHYFPAGDHPSVWFRIGYAASMNKAAVKLGAKKFTFASGDHNYLPMAEHMARIYEGGDPRDVFGIVFRIDPSDKLKKGFMTRNEHLLKARKVLERIKSEESEALRKEKQEYNQHVLEPTIQFIRDSGRGDLLDLIQEGLADICESREISPFSPHIVINNLPSGTPNKLVEMAKTPDFTFEEVALHYTSSDKRSYRDSDQTSSRFYEMTLRVGQDFASVEIGYNRFIYEGKDRDYDALAIELVKETDHYFNIDKILGISCIVSSDNRL